MFIPALTSGVAKKINCLLILPELALFIFLNIVILSHESKVCAGAYLNNEELEEYKGFLLTSERWFLKLTLLSAWSIIAYAVLGVCCVHVCFTFRCRV